MPEKRLAKTAGHGKEERRSEGRCALEVSFAAAKKKTLTTYAAQLRKNY